MATKFSDLINMCAGFYLKTTLNPNKVNNGNICIMNLVIYYSNMTSFKRFESKPVVKIILIYDVIDNL